MKSKLVEHCGENHTKKMKASALSSDEHICEICGCLPDVGCLCKVMNSKGKIRFVMC